MDRTLANADRFARSLVAGWANSRPSELPPPVYCARGHVPESRGQRSWPATGHSLVTSLVTGLLPWDQGGAEGRTLLRTLPKGPGPWHRGAAPRSSECPLFRGNGDSSGPGTGSVPNGSRYIQAGREDPVKQRCLFSFLLKFSSINKRKLERKFQLPINSSQGLFHSIIQSKGTVDRWEGRVLQL